MKRVIIICILLMCLTGCKDSSETKIELESNITTGYTWECEVNDYLIVKKVSSEYVAPKGDLQGAPGKQIFLFKGLKEGKTDITCSYFRSWEKDAEPINKKAYEAIVDNKLRIKINDITID